MLLSERQTHAWTGELLIKLAPAPKQHFKPVIRNGGNVSTIVAERYTSDIRVVGTTHELSWRRRKQMTSSNTHIYNTNTTTNYATDNNYLKESGHRWKKLYNQ